MQIVTGQFENATVTCLTASALVTFETGTFAWR